MAISWSNPTSYVSIGVDWNATTSDTAVTIAPKVYRWDKYNTNNYGSTFSETLTNEPNGQQGYWSGFTWGSGKDTRQVENFSARTYERKTSAYTVKLKVSWDSSFGSWHPNNYFATIGAGSDTWTLTIPALPVYEPKAPTGASVTRNDDNKATITWTHSSTDSTHPRSGYKVEVSINGGAWSQVATVTGNSYIASSLSADNTYKFRVRAYNSGGNSGYSTTGVITMTPAAPTKVSGSRTGTSGVALVITNDSRTATSTEIQRCTDKNNSATYTSVTTTSTKATSYNDNAGGGTFYYRARNKNGSLTSGWSAWSDAVITICAPSAPTLVTPASGLVISKAEQSIEFNWLHNSLDGSTQTAAELRYSVDGGGTWVTKTGTNKSQLVLENTYEVNTTVQWQVRTKGVHSDFSPWSAISFFRIYQEPTVVFANPSDGFVLEDMPLNIELQYVDSSGALAEATLRIIYEGSTVLTRSMGNSTKYQINVSDYLPLNKSTITLEVVARSTSSLVCMATREVTVDFVEPEIPSITTNSDEESSSCEITVGCGADSARLSLYRIIGESRILLADYLQDGQSIVDIYAPVNREYEYELISYAESGAYSVKKQIVLNESSFAFWVSPNGFARSKWNPNTSTEINRSNASTVRFVGRELPVAFDTEVGIDWTPSYSGVVQGKEERERFISVIKAGSQFVYKAHSGEVYHVQVKTVNLAEWQSLGDYYNVTVTMQRVDGDDV